MHANDLPLGAATLNATVGELVALADDGATPLVLFPGLDGPRTLPARSTVDLHGAHIGRSVLLLFEHGDPTRPIVVGVLQDPAARPEREGAPFAVEADGRRLVLGASGQVVLRCGKASITLTSAGKVLIEGAYVLSRATGVNRIKGGSVQLN